MIVNGFYLCRLEPFLHVQQCKAEKIDSCKPREMLLMGEKITAEKALQIGLITRLVPENELIEEVTKMANNLAKFAPFVPQTIKAIVNFGMESSLAGALMFEKYAQGALVQTEDKAEGISAFLEKRTPKFKGK